ncbi:T9SS C-terminal target domain-containing protein [Sphingobacteriales bacterium UPWRP_1]|nr:hypothetical protein B6N25_00990 [Sphingobacteriales bacterium TSM_CSS]PSJ72505.1 T9SS C-terminal target domain-containing protein [Sphingobacteriales bacterium UPWRP_1]
MKHIKKITALLFFLTVMAPAAFALQANYVPGDMLLQLLPGKKVETVLQDFRTFEGKTTRLRVHKNLAPTLRIYQLRFDYTRIDQQKLLHALFHHPAVQTVQNNHLVTYRATIPNDPQFPDQWQYINDGSSGGVPDADIDAELAWDITTGGVTAIGDTIVVCIVDDGLDLTHQDFAGNRWFNYAEIPGNGIDDDGNGYTDDYRGWNADFTNDDISGGFFGGWHGTPVTGIVGARGNNNIGVAGVNWNVKLMVVVGGGDEAAAIAAYAYPLTMRTRYNDTNGQQGAFVVATNSSWGTDYGQPEDAPLWCAMYDEMGEQGILSAGATANVNLNVDVDGDLPTACPSDYLIAVTNMRRNDVKVTQAAYGLINVDLGAFGEDTWTAAKGNQYEGFGGTSGATPHVAGTVGLIYSAPCYQLAALAHSNPAAAALLVKQFILDGTDPNASLAGITVTGGRLNLFNSLQLAMSMDCANTGCPVPFGITAATILDTSADITWQAPDGATGYLIQYKQVSEVNWQTATAETNAFTLTGLVPCTAYQVAVATVCDTIASGFSFNFNFNTEGCCVPPAQLSVEPVTDNTVNVTWQSVFAANSYWVEYRPTATGVTWQTAATIGNETSLLLNALMPCTQYEIRVGTVCNTGGISNLSNIITFTTTGCGYCIDATYCNISSLDDTYEHIQTVSIDAFTNNSGESGGYENFTSLSDINLQAGNSYEIALTPGFSAETYEEYWKIWIDYNQDSNFDDQTELAFDAGGAQSTTVNGSISVPTWAETGSTRLRVAMKWTGDGSDPAQPCGDFEYGEAEDYCVNILGAASCAPLTPDNLQTTNITENGAQLNWTGSPSCDTYTLQYAVSGTTNWTTVSNLTGNSTQILALSEGTPYTWQVQCNCSDGSSNFSDPATFNTFVSCALQIPGNLSVSEIGETTAQLNWQSLAACSSYSIQYRPLGSPTWQTVLSVNNTTLLSDLSPSTQYEFRVRCNCSNSSSDYSEVLSFGTFALGIDQNGQMQIYAYPNPFSSEILLSNQLLVTGVYDLLLLDLSGKNVFTQPGVLLQNGITRITPGQLPAGVYFLQVKQQGAVIYTQRLAKISE